MGCLVPQEEVQLQPKCVNLLARARACLILVLVVALESEEFGDRKADAGCQRRFAPFRIAAVVRSFRGNIWVKSVMSHLNGSVHLQQIPIEPGISPAP